MIDAIDKAIASMHEQIANLIDLKKLFMIADLLGVPPKSIKGRTQTQITQTGSGFVHDQAPWLKSTYSIRVEGGEWKDFKLVDVPPLLWPTEWQKRYKP